MTTPSTIRAVAEWDGYGWVATLADVPGAVTQAKRLDILPGRLAEVAKLMTGDQVAAEQIALEVRVADDDIDRVAREIEGLEQELGRVTEALSSRRRQLVTELHDRGHTLRDIGVIVHLSHQRGPTRRRGGRPISLSLTLNHRSARRSRLARACGTDHQDEARRAGDGLGSIGLSIAGRWLSPST